MSNDDGAPVSGPLGREAFLPRDAFARSELLSLQSCPDLTITDETINKKLIARLFDNQGFLATDPYYDCVYMVEVGSRTIVFRIDHLKWQMASDKRWSDFPRFLMRHFIAPGQKRDRDSAERLARGLLRFAYFGDWKALDALVNAAKGIPCTP